MKFLLWMVPACKTCIHYIPRGQFDSPLSECKQMSSIDVVSGQIEYSLANRVRENECNGELYTPEPELELKKWRHDVKQNIKYIACALLYLSLFAYTKIK